MISAINIANQNGKSIVTMAFSAQRAALQNTSPDTGAITAALSGGTNETGQINFYALAPPATPYFAGLPACWIAVTANITSTRPRVNRTTRASMPRRRRSLSASAEIPETRVHISRLILSIK